MTLRSILFASVAAFGVTAGAGAQSVANRETAQLLSPFTVLNSTAAGRQALVDNLEASIAINNASSPAQRLQARADNAIFTDYGQQFTEALGTRLDTAYQAARIAGGPDFATAGPIVQAFRGFSAVSGGDSAFNKIFLANGTTDNVHPAVGIDLPAGGIFNTYDVAYGVNKTDPGQNPNGDSRPFQVAPTRIDPFAADITATLVTNSAFPSGHTTFGTTEALLVAMAVPERFQQVFARGLEYGYSRVVLGAHYTLDVIAGRILGLHDVAQLLNNNPDYTGDADFAARFSDFASAFRSVLTAAAGTDIATAAKDDSGRFSDAAATRAVAAQRLTYGLTPVGPTDRAAVVPLGAEVLLKTRFTYLTAEQRRAVLASTELASGAPLDDGSGWARLDLYTAAGGYGAFDGAVVVDQDAALGGFAAADIFSNDIGGSGSLTHTGSGVLTLTGLNSYAGGTTIAGGTVVAASATALGSGDVLLADGTLRVAAPGFTIGGDYVQTGGLLALGGVGNAPVVTIAGFATLGGALSVDLNGAGYGAYELIDWAGHDGAFDSVSFAGRRLRTSLDYRSDGLYLDVASVPEPATWAMLIGGFGAVGMAARRRRRVVAG